MRPKASADIAEARDKGDLSENAECEKKHKEC
jgi:transcription elongation GreA/GreB family factor